MKDYVLPAGAPLQKISALSAEWVPTGLLPVIIEPPFVFQGTPVNAAILPPVTFTEYYIITTDENKTLRDSSGNVFEYLVGTRPKKHRP